MARKPNYGFERKERERAKAAKAAERVKAKAGGAGLAPEGAGELTEAPLQPNPDPKETSQ